MRKVHFRLISLINDFRYSETLRVTVPWLLIEVIQVAFLFIGILFILGHSYHAVICHLRCYRSTTAYSLDDSLLSIAMPFSFRVGGLIIINSVELSGFWLLRRRYDSLYNWFIVWSIFLDAFWLLLELISRYIYGEIAFYWHLITSLSRIILKRLILIPLKLLR